MSLHTQKYYQRVWPFYVMPALCIYTIFMAFPLLNSIGLSFFSTSRMTTTEFVGLHNYFRIFTDPHISIRYWSAFWHTWIFFAVHMLVQNVLGILFANMLSTKGLRGSTFYRTIIFLPATLAIVVTGYLWKLILNPQWGALNLLLKELGVGNHTMAWLGDPSTALLVVSLVSSWQWVGIPTMMFLAGLTTIPDDLFEAAEIEGANKWHIFWHIKVAQLKPIIGIVVILTFVNNFNAFDVVFAMETVNGAPQYATDILGTFFYRTGIAGQHPIGIPDRGLGGAVAATTFIVLAIGVGIVLRFTRSERERIPNA